MRLGFRKVFTRFAFQCPVCGFTVPGRCVAEQHEESLVACCTGCSEKLQDEPGFRGNVEAFSRLRPQFNAKLPNAYWNRGDHQWYAISGTGDAAYCEPESTVPADFPAYA